MPRSYNGNISTTEDYLIYLYTNGFHKSNYIGDDKVIKICNNVGVFKLKGYVKEIKHLAVKNIDDVLVIYLFDKFLSKIFFDLTSRIEAKLKSILINECYLRTTNHFFYLKENTHKWTNYKIDFSTVKNWEVRTNTTNPIEAYSHYILFYLQNYAFNDNRRRYLAGSTLLSTVDIVKYNYPPFKYLIESATLGSVNAFIKSLKIGTTDINKQVSRHFGVGRNTTIFNHYLDRLNEIRNRTAHGGRIYNRTFRSVTGVGKYQIFRMGIDNHKAMDVYLFLLNLLNQLDKHSDIHEFTNDHIKRLFSTFKRDCITNRESNNLVKKYRKKDFNKIKGIIYSKMKN